MSRLFILHGVPQDAGRIQDLAKRMNLLGYESIINDDSSVLSTNYTGLNSKEFEELSLDVVNLLCWTAISAGPLGIEFQEIATRAQHRANYFNLVLEDVQMPNAITGKKLKFDGGLSEGGTGSKSNFSGIDCEFEGFRSAASLHIVIVDTLRTVHDLIVRVNAKLSGIKKLAFMAALSSLASLAYSVIRREDTICQVGILQSPCRFLNLGHLPSKKAAGGLGKGQGCL